MPSCSSAVGVSSEDQSSTITTSNRLLSIVCVSSAAKRRANDPARLRVETATLMSGADLNLIVEQSSSVGGFKSLVNITRLGRPTRTVPSPVLTICKHYTAAPTLSITVTLSRPT